MCSRQSWFLVALVIGIQMVTWSCQRTTVAVTPSEPVTALAPLTAQPPPPGATPIGGMPGAAGARVVVQLTEQGFVPDHIPAEVGKPLTLVITRKTDKTCAREIMFKGQPGKTDLPLNKQVEVIFTPKSSGSVPFGCAMGMMVGGALEVR